jgi:hypothetical protein
MRAMRIISLLNATRRGHLILALIQISHNVIGPKIATFTLEQKANITTGIGGICTGNVPPVDDFPGLCLEDSPLGVRLADFTTAFPAGINSATT